MKSRKKKKKTHILSASQLVWDISFVLGQKLTPQTVVLECQISHVITNNDIFLHKSFFPILWENYCTAETKFNDFSTPHLIFPETDEINTSNKPNQNHKLKRKSRKRERERDDTSFREREFERMKKASL